MPPTIDPATLTPYLTAEVKKKFSALIAGVATDMDAYLAQIVPDYSACIANGDAEGVKELNIQIRMLAEKHRLTAVQATWHMVGQFFLDGAQFVAAILLKSAVALDPEPEGKEEGED